MRAFIAIDFDPAVRRALADLQDRLRARLPNLKWIAAYQLHLTIKFLGEIEESSAPALGASLDVVLGPRAPFDVNPGGLGRFGPRGDVGVLGVGASE